MRGFDSSGFRGLGWYMHPKPEISQTTLNAPKLDPKLQAIHRAFCAAISTPSSPTRADSRIGRALEARVGAVCCCFVFDRAFFFHCVSVQSSGVCLLFLGLVLSGVKVWGSKSRRFPVRQTANLKPRTQVPKRAYEFGAENLQKSVKPVHGVIGLDQCISFML